MSYVRPVRQNELVEWLIANGVQPFEAEELAIKLRDRFDVITTSASP